MWMVFKYQHFFNLQLQGAYAPNGKTLKSKKIAICIKKKVGLLLKMFRKGDESIRSKTYLYSVSFRLNQVFGRTTPRNNWIKRRAGLCLKWSWDLIQPLTSPFRKIKAAKSVIRVLLLFGTLEWKHIYRRACHLQWQMSAAFFNLTGEVPKGKVSHSWYSSEHYLSTVH